MTWLIALWAHTAAASPIVLHQGDEETVRNAVAGAAQVAPSTLSMTNFDAFGLSMAAQWSGSGSMEKCSGDAVPLQEVADNVAGAESKLLYMELDAANDALVQAQAKLVCVDSVLDPSVVARIGFLRGVIATVGDKGNDAWKSFSFAARFDPAMEWDDQYPADGRGTLNGAKEALASSDTIDVGVTPSISVGDGIPKLFLNSAPILDANTSFAVPAGLNVLQVQTQDGVVGYQLEIKAESRPQLFLPELITADTLARVVTEDGRSDLSKVIRQAYEAGTPVYVAHDEGVWRTAAGGTWETLRAPTSSLSAAGGGMSTLSWVGTGLAAGSLVSTVVAALLVRHEKNNFETHAQSGQDFMANKDTEREVNWRNARTAALAGVGVGASMTVVGLIIKVPAF